jgi:hypothetical protein
VGPTPSACGTANPTGSTTVSYACQ